MRRTQRLTLLLVAVVTVTLLYRMNAAGDEIFADLTAADKVSSVLGDRHRLRTHTADTDGGRQRFENNNNNNNNIGGDLQSTTLTADLLPESVVSTPSLHIITVQTRPSEGWCRMLLTAALTNRLANEAGTRSERQLAVNTLAWNHRYAHSKRPRWILEWITKKTGDGLRDTDVVMFADGSDTFFTGVPYDEILRNFLRAEAHSDLLRGEESTSDASSKSINLSFKETTTRSLLFNAEANCYHQQLFTGSWGVNKGKCLSTYKRFDPTVKSKFRYLNAGAWIGRVWAAKRVFAEAMHTFEKNRNLWCDQSVLGGIFISRKYEDFMSIDYSNAVFLPSYHVRIFHDFINCESSASWNPLALGGSSDAKAQRWCKMASLRNESTNVPRLRMRDSGNVPALIHLNGKARGFLKRALVGRSAWSTLWTSASDTERRAIVNSTVTLIDGKAVGIGQLCADIVTWRP